MSDAEVIDGSSDTVLYQVDNGVATVTLNRPDRMNALTGTMVGRLREVMRAAADDEEVRVVILTGAGRSFCAGGDVNALATSPSRSHGNTERIAEMRRLVEIAELLTGMDKPTIAAVNGACAGAGIGFACACDLRFSSSAAVFATAFLRVGLPGDHGAVWSVTRAVGPATARQLFLLGDRFDAAEALRIGLVHSVHPPGELETHVRAVTRRLVDSAPIALASLKANLNDAVTLGLSDYLDHEVERFIHCAATDDAREAATAYVEKRVPTFHRR